MLREGLIFFLKSWLLTKKGGVSGKTDLLREAARKKTV